MILPMRNPLLLIARVARSAPVSDPCRPDQLAMTVMLVTYSDQEEARKRWRQPLRERIRGKLMVGAGGRI